MSRLAESTVDPLERTVVHTSSVQQINLQDHRKTVKMLRPWAASQCCLYSVITKPEMCSMFTCGSIAQIRSLWLRLPGWWATCTCSRIGSKVESTRWRSGWGNRKITKPSTRGSSKCWGWPSWTWTCQSNFYMTISINFPEVWTRVCMLISVST